jgi:hypothetical protein
VLSAEKCVPKLAGGPGRRALGGNRSLETQGWIVAQGRVKVREVPRRGTRSLAVGETYGQEGKERKDIRPRRGRTSTGDAFRGFHPRLMTFGPLGAGPPTRL